MAAPPPTTLAARPKTADERLALMERQIATLLRGVPAAPQLAPAPFLAQAGDVLQVRISELPPAHHLNLRDYLEISQLSVAGTPTTRRGTIEQLTALVPLPDLSPFLTAIGSGTGIQVVGSAPAPSVSLAGNVTEPGQYGDAEHVPQITVDQFGRVTGVVLVPIDVSYLADFAPLASPAFTGTPTAPTRPATDSTTGLATTEFVQREIAALALAGLDSPTFIGTPSGPTAEEDTSTAQLATTEFVQQAIALGASITVGFAPPTAPRPNQLWWHSAFGQLFIFFNDGESSQWVPASPAVSNVQIPPGTVSDFAGANAPFGWYLCDGASKDRLLDAPLFAAIGTLYGDGDGGEDATTFSLPDLRGRVTAMPDGGTERLTSIADEIAATGGEETHTLAVDEMPTHNHAIIDPSHLHAMLTRADLTGGGAFGAFASAAGALGGTTQSGYTGISIQNAGGGEPHANVQPTLLMNKIIKR